VLSQFGSDYMEDLSTYMPILDALQYATRLESVLVCGSTPAESPDRSTANFEISQRKGCRS